MATNPELEAAIENAPDDDDAFFVYGDWLQTEGDPRGELIALQAAVLRDPGDKKLAQRADRFLEDHADELAGPVWPRVGKREVKLHWHLGFVRSAYIELPTPEAIAALHALLEHPAGRFVQSLGFGEAVHAAKLAAALRELARPATLADLRIPGAGEDAIADLARVFPRLGKAIDAAWERIRGELASARKLDVKYDGDALPALLPLPDVDAPVLTNDEILLGLRIELGKGRDLGIVAALRRSFAPESLDRFVVALGEQFAAAGQPTAMRWGFDAIGRLGGPLATAWIGDRIGARFAGDGTGWSHQRAVQGAQMLGQIGSGTAIWELHALVSDPRAMRARREAAAGVLERIAKARGLDVHRLLDRSTPPTAHADRVREAAARRLCAHMIDGRRIGSHDFVHYFVNHPVIAPLARRVLWATYDGIDVETTFRIDGDGKALDAAGDAVDLDGARVGVVHPAELAADERRATLKEWGEVFSDEELEPLFEQLERPVHEPREQETHAITRFKLRSAGWEQLRTRFERVLDWTPDREEHDAGSVTIGWEHHFPRDNVSAYAKLTDGSIEEIVARRDGKRVAFDKLHPVTVSEIIHAGEQATSREVAHAGAPAAAIDKGTRVRVLAGAGRGSAGVVFWLGDGNNGPRCGLRTDDNETVWANISDVAVETGAAPAPAPAPPPKDDEDDELAFAKGDKVRWKKGRHDGTGVAFWIGKNKFGDGMRVGVKDDATGETVWVDANDCEPEA